jgi:hypothetical protein
MPIPSINLKSLCSSRDISGFVSLPISESNETKPPRIAALSPSLSVICHLVRRCLSVYCYEPHFLKVKTFTHQSFLCHTSNINLIIVL